MASADENCPSVSGTIDVFDVSETVVVFDDKIVAAAKEFGLVRRKIHVNEIFFRIFSSIQFSKSRHLVLRCFPDWVSGWWR